MMGQRLWRWPIIEPDSTADDTDNVLRWLNKNGEKNDLTDACPIGWKMTTLMTSWVAVSVTEDMLVCKLFIFTVEVMFVANYAEKRYPKFASSDSLRVKPNFVT